MILGLGNKSMWIGLKKNIMVYLKTHTGTKRQAPRWKSKVCLTHPTGLPPALHGLSHSFILRKLPAAQQTATDWCVSYCVYVWGWGPLTKRQYLTTLLHAAFKTDAPGAFHMPKSLTKQQYLTSWEWEQAGHLMSSVSWPKSYAWMHHNDYSQWQTSTYVSGIKSS